MVTVTIGTETLELEVSGVHKLWAMKSRLTIPLADIREVRHDPERANKWWKGLRLPGTHVPFLYAAGTFYQNDFRPDFWSVRKTENAIVIQCADGSAYDEIIVEVEDPTGTVDQIRNALPKRA